MQSELRILKKRLKYSIKRSIDYDITYGKTFNLFYSLRNKLSVNDENLRKICLSNPLTSLLYSTYVSKVFNKQDLLLLNKFSKKTIIYYFCHVMKFNHD